MDDFDDTEPAGVGGRDRQHRLLRGGQFLCLGWLARTQTDRTCRRRGAHTQQRRGDPGLRRPPPAVCRMACGSPSSPLRYFFVLANHASTPALRLLQALAGRLLEDPSPHLYTQFLEPLLLVRVEQRRDLLVERDAELAQGLHLLQPAELGVRLQRTELLELGLQDRNDLLLLLFGQLELERELVGQRCQRVGGDLRCRHDLVVDMAELVAARGEVGVTHLEEGERIRVLRHRDDELAALDAVGGGRPLVAAARDVAECAREDGARSNAQHGRLSPGRERLEELLAGHVVAQPDGLADDERLELRVVQRGGTLLLQARRRSCPPQQACAPRPTACTRSARSRRAPAPSAARRRAGAARL